MADVTRTPLVVLTPAQLAQKFQVPVSWIYEQSRNRKTNLDPLPTHKIGRYLRFDAAEVEEWFRRQLCTSKKAEKHRGR